MAKIESIYDMELHDTMAIDNNSISILRVHDGWIYTRRFQGISSVFVPLHRRVTIENEAKTY